MTWLGAYTDRWVLCVIVDCFTRREQRFSSGGNVANGKENDRTKPVSAIQVASCYVHISCDLQAIAVCFMLLRETRVLVDPLNASYTLQ